MIARQAATTLRGRLRRLPGSEQGFTMIATLAVMLVTSTMVTVAFVASEGDIQLTQHDLNATQSYYAARGGVNDFIHHLKQDSNYWATCPTQPTTNLPGSTTQRYSYQPVPANPPLPCDVSDPINTMIDTGTGSFRMLFTGYAGTPQTSRSLVASFRRNSPLDFLWYTVYETLDPNTYQDPAFAADPNNCKKWKRDGRTGIAHDDPDGQTRTYCGDIDWITGDNIKGSMYTQDQYSVCGAPVFGRDSNDKIESLAGGSALYDGCSPGGNNADVRGTLVDSGAAPYIPLPTANAQLKDDALAGYGTVFNGPTTIDFQGATARVTNNGTTTVVNLVQKPIIYVDNDSQGCGTLYSPYSVDYSPGADGGCGNAYVSGNYSQPVTVAAANDVIVTNDVCANSCATPGPVGQALLGIVGNNFVRVQHGIANRSGRGDCGNGNDPATTHNDIRIDAAILALQHSFIVDNYDCGTPIGALTVNGAIAQNYRGTVGTHSGPVVRSGYVKNYTYDNRLAVREPPYLFDINDASWHIERETLCIVGSDC